MMMAVVSPALVRRMNWPVMTELAMFQCLLTSSVSCSSGVAPRSAQVIARRTAEPTTTSLPRKVVAQAVGLAEQPLA
jgi:hypothetical protein